MSEVKNDEWIEQETKRIKALGETAPRLARDPVSQPIINAWLDAIEETDSRFTEGLAPPAMAQVWTMYGLDPSRPSGDPLHSMMGVMDEAGYESVLGTNCDQTYDRYLRPGELVSVTTRLESVVGPKQTGVGEGYFVTTRSTWRVGDEQVASMLFRVLKFKPKQREPASPQQDITDPRRTVRPVVNRDTAFFWEGAQVRELRIQRCSSCGSLRHPPGPMCPACQAVGHDYVLSAGRGSVYSYVVHHAPQIPGKTLPLLIALVELEEGVRMIGELRGVGIDDVEIGLPVRVGYDRIDDELTLPFWEVVDS